MGFCYFEVASINNCVGKVEGDNKQYVRNFYGVEATLVNPDAQPEDKKRYTLARATVCEILDLDLGPIQLSTNPVSSSVSFF